MDFPRTVDEITPEWLTTVLRESGAFSGAQVERFEAIQLDGGVAGEVFRLRLFYALEVDDVALTVVAKMSLADERHREMMRDGGVYEREIGFYQRLAPTSGMRSPATYFTEVDPVSGYSMILMEDIGHLRTVDQYASEESEELTLNDALAATASLVSLHANLWSDDSLYQYQWLGNARNPEQIDHQSVQYNDALESFIETFGEFLPEHYESIARNFGRKSRDVIELYGLSPQTFVHGDFRLANVLFDDVATGINRVVAFDWQLIGISNAATDLSYFISASMSTTNRRKHEEALFTAYYEGLKEQGITDYSESEFEVDIRLGALRAAAILTKSAVNLDLKNLLESEEGLQVVKSAMNRLQTIIDWNCDEVIPK